MEGVRAQRESQRAVSALEGSEGVRGREGSEGSEGSEWGERGIRVNEPPISICVGRVTLHSVQIKCCSISGGQEQHGRTVVKHETMLAACVCLWPR